MGDPKGACDDAALSLAKLISRGLHDAINDPSVPEAARSPAYDVLQRFTINEFQLGEIFQMWKKGGTPRDAVCGWAASNYESFLEPLMPRSHPRSLQQTDTSALTYASVTLGLFSSFLVAITTVAVYRQKDRRVFRYAQVDFLWILLFGGFILGAGASLVGAPASSATCIAAVWLVNTGYSCMLVPLIVKVHGGPAAHRVWTLQRSQHETSAVARATSSKILSTHCLSKAQHTARWERKKQKQRRTSHLRKVSPSYPRTSSRSLPKAR